MTGIVDMTGPAKTHNELVEWFLENACPDHHVRGGPDHIMARHTAMSVLSRHPDIARDSLYTAVVCGDLLEVTRILAERPESASTKDGEASEERAGVGGAAIDSEKISARRVGSRCYISASPGCHMRRRTTTRSPSLARFWIEARTPMRFFMAGGSRYTPLVGVIGEGEEGRPPHPHRDSLTKLLLDYGAEPYHIQVVYNIGFSGNVLWFLKLIYARAVALGRRADWEDPNWSMLGMGGYGSGARWHLDIAVKHNDLALAEWILSHGASPNAPPASDARFSQRTLYEEAVRNGQTDMAGLLARNGATTGTIAGGERRVRRGVSESGSRAGWRARGCASGISPGAGTDDDGGEAGPGGRGRAAPRPRHVSGHRDSRQGRQRPLHVAAYADSPRVTALLIERGAKIDPIDDMHGGTPLWFAVWGLRQRAIELLSPVSQDVWSLSLTGTSRACARC